MADCELAHPRTRSCLSQRPTRIQDTLCLLQRDTRELVRSLRSALPGVQCPHTAVVELRVITVNRRSMNPDRRSQSRNRGQAQLRHQGRCEAHTDRVVLPALVDRPGGVEQDDLALAPHDREIGTDDLRPGGQQRQSGDEVSSLHVTHELYRIRPPRQGKSAVISGSGQEPCSELFRERPLPPQNRLRNSSAGSSVGSLASRRTASLEGRTSGCSTSRPFEGLQRVLRQGPRRSMSWYCLSRQHPARST